MVVVVAVGRFLPVYVEYLLNRSKSDQKKRKGSGTEKRKKGWLTKGGGFRAADGRRNAIV